MPDPSPHSRLAVWLAAAIALGAPAASAQEAVPSSDSLAGRTKLERACAAALDRFCPDLAEPPGQTRNQVICLRPYRTSLTPSCRAAVNAALP